MTNIVCTMYEIFFEYLGEAVLEDGIDKKAIRNASKVLEHLKDSLNFEYDISSNLFSLYDFCERQLAKALYTNNPNELSAARKIMGELQESFKEVDKQDNSGAAMQHSQQISAGLTYGKTDVTETLDDAGSNRGFLA